MSSALHFVVKHVEQGSSKLLHASLLTRDDSFHFILCIMIIPLSEQHDTDQPSCFLIPAVRK